MRQINVDYKQKLSETNNSEINNIWQQDSHVSFHHIINIFESRNVGSYKSLL